MPEIMVLLVYLQNSHRSSVEFTTGNLMTAGQTFLKEEQLNTNATRLLEAVVHTQGLPKVALLARSLAELVLQSQLWVGLLWLGWLVSVDLGVGQVKAWR
ncbi:hypothetical protein, partial [Kitasatospora sp. NPDC088346]|uniref:hypothetical protein n=1 Tax=Kitasatospora sp. NPDC088346 TaxID=3364073 RepID=UPI00380FF058